MEDTIHPYLENMGIILELYKFFGRDFSVVLAYDIFKKINKKVTNNSTFSHNEGKTKYTESDMRNMFIVALQNLKYMGYFSATR